MRSRLELDQIAVGLMLAEIRALKYDDEPAAWRDIRELLKGLQRDELFPLIEIVAGMGGAFAATLAELRNMDPEAFVSGFALVVASGIGIDEEEL